MLQTNSAKPAFSVFFQLLLPLWAVLFLLWIGIEPINTYLAKLCYLGDGRWLAHEYLSPAALRRAARLVPASAAVLALILAALSYSNLGRRLAVFRPALLYVAASIVLCSLAIAAGRRFGISTCPANLPEFGGMQRGIDYCFSSGHPGSAFCLISLCFAARSLLPAAHRRKILAAVLAAGLLFGAVLQLQGAHFVSHTLASLCFDWFLCALLYTLTIGRGEVRTWRVTFPSSFLLAAAVCFFWVSVYNLPFWYRAIEGLSVTDAKSWIILVSCYVILLLGCSAASMLGIFPRAIKALLVLFSMLGAAGFYFAHNFGTIINPPMIRNVLATNYAEASELLGLGFFTEYGFLLLPTFYLIFLSKVKKHSVPRTIAVSSAWVAGCVAAGAAVIFLSFQGISSLLRGEPVLRNLITPLNILSATAKTLTGDSDPSKKRPRAVIDPSPTMEKTAGRRGVLFVVVVGETARLANWGLAGYERNTTPELARRGVYAFQDTTACGTSTDVSLPCMFSRVGRRNYDRKRILGEESLLPVLSRAGARVFWVDNQSGSKGVSDGVTNLPIDKSQTASLCKNGECFDSALLVGLDSRVLDAPGDTTVVFMHQLGNHGPSYYKRYPDEFEKWKPVCRQDQLQKCTRQEIVNAYDNALLYTDSFLAGVIDWLGSLKNMDTAMLYVSDHGESLGENNMYLHGAPLLLAPSEQLKVPMALWMSDGYKKRIGLDDAAMQKRTKEPVSHDCLYSSLLALLQVKSSTYDKNCDFTAGARRKTE
jgi:lipid A ethanolaminephosphotransferase